MRMYEIDQSINDELEKTDPETGEWLGSIEALENLKMERTKKIENVLLWIKMAVVMIDAIRNEEKKLAERRKKLEAKVESLKAWVSEILGYEKFETGSVAASFRSSKAVEVDEEKLPKKWFKKKITYTPDKTAIKKALDQGVKVKGASIVERENIQIK